MKNNYIYVILKGSEPQPSMDTPKQCVTYVQWRCPDVIIVNVEHILYIVVVIPLLTVNAGWEVCWVPWLFQGNMVWAHDVSGPLGLHKIKNWTFLLSILCCFRSSYPLPKKWSFPLRTSSVNMAKFTGNCGLGYIFWRNP